MAMKITRRAREQQKSLATKFGGVVVTRVQSTNKVVMENKINIFVFNSLYHLIFYHVKKIYLKWFIFTLPLQRMIASLMNVSYGLSMLVSPICLSRKNRIGLWPNFVLNEAIE